MARTSLNLHGRHEPFLIRMRNVRAQHNQVPAISAEAHEDVGEPATGIILVASESGNPAQTAPSFTFEDLSPE
jgi:hypothetical protein